MDFTEHVIAACVLWLLAIGHSYLLETKNKKQIQKKAADPDQAVNTNLTSRSES